MGSVTEFGGFPVALDERSTAPMTRRKQTPRRDPIERFVDAAVAEAQAMDKNDSKTANRIHERDLVPALREVVASGPEQIQRVVDLVDHAEASVAHTAAVFALRYDAPRAERALERLIEHPALHIGFSAEWCLREWREGSLEFA